MDESFPLPQHNAVIRRATKADVPAIIRLHSEDVLGKTREVYAEPLPESYYKAFAEISADPKQFYAVLEREGQVIGSLQLTLLPGLTLQGSTRAQIEAVQITAFLRGLRLGEALVLWAVEYARSKGAKMAQLTSNKTRRDAHRFYERLGFERSHEGFKLKL
jgi:ribosomal protein S18 acetylase RimI-like enzyme